MNMHPIAKKRLCLQARMCNCSVQALQLLMKISSVIHKHLVCVIVVACRVRLSISSRAMQGRPAGPQVNKSGLQLGASWFSKALVYLNSLPTAFTAYFSRVALWGSVLCYQTPVCVCSVRLVSPLLKCVTHFPPRALFCWRQHFWQKLPPWMLMWCSLVLEGQVELVNNLKVCLAGGWRVASNKLSIWVFAEKLACYKVGEIWSKERGIPVHLTLIRHKASLTSEKQLTFMSLL